MKRIPRLLVLIAFTLSTQLTFAASLKESMQAIGGEFRGIFMKAKDPTKDAETLQHAKNLKAAFEGAKLQYPTLVSELPVAEQPAARQRFEQLIQTGIVISDDLIAAIQGGRRDDIQIQLTKLTDLKKTGHLEFQ